MKQVLVVAEKPSLATDLAKTLSAGRMKTRTGCGSWKVHEFQAEFLSMPAKFKITSVSGHIMKTSFIGKFANCNGGSPLELFKAPIEKREVNPQLEIPKFLQMEGHGIDYLVLWLDCDMEGENICFEVINAVKPSMNIPHDRNEQVIFRAKFSAITEKDIKVAMKQLVEPNKNAALYVDARQELDLRVGCAFSKFQTKFFQDKYENLNSDLISFGLCQTPTLGLCVDRHDKIASFKPEPYWVLKVKVIAPNGHVLTLDWDRIKIFDNEVANDILSKVKNKKNAMYVFLN